MSSSMCDAPNAQVPARSNVAFLNLLEEKTMKTSRSFVFAFLMAIAPLHALAFQIITDEALFNSLYVNPSETVDFSHLIDGSTPSTACRSLLVTSCSLGWNRNYFSVREYGWSENVWIGSRPFDPQRAWTATAWDGSSITPEVYAFFYLNFAVDALASATPLRTKALNNQART